MADLDVFLEEVLHVALREYEVRLGLGDYKVLVLDGVPLIFDSKGGRLESQVH